MLDRELLDDADSFVAANLIRRRQMASRGGVTDDKIKEVRAIMGPEPSDMDIIRALYQSKNDVSSAINILFDTVKWDCKGGVTITRRRGAARSPNAPPSNVPPAPAPPPVTEINKPIIKELPQPPRPDNRNGSGEKVPLAASQPSSQVPVALPGGAQAVVEEVGQTPPQATPEGGDVVQSVVNFLALDMMDSSVSTASVVVPKVENVDLPDLDMVVNLNQGPVPTQAIKETQLNTSQVEAAPPIDVIDLTQPDNMVSQENAAKHLSPDRAAYKHHPKLVKSVTTLKQRDSNAGLVSSQLREELTVKVDSQALYTKALLQLQAEWKEDLVLLGQSEVLCLSTCKGQKLSPGDDLMFSFPKSVSEPLEYRRGWGRGKGAAAASEIVRFSTEKAGEIGRLPGEWARNLIPLVSSKKVAISGICTYCPATLGLLDSITLQLGTFVSRTLLKKYTASPSSTSVSQEISTHNPLLSVLRLLGKKPFLKAEFTPEDLYNRKRSLDSENAKKNGVSEPILSSDKRQKLSTGAAAVPGKENEGEEISEADLNKIVGTSEGSELLEMDPPSNIVCELRPYQKQALFWMTNMETGRDLEEAAKTLHPCWEAYCLGDEKSVFYVNVFSGDSSVDFPSALQTSRGGILADAMGLGKTVMGISLLVSSPGRGGIYTPGSIAPLIEKNTVPGMATQVDESAITQVPPAKFKIGSRDSNGKLRGGGTLIVCPMTLLGQWKTEIETHVKPGVLSVLTYYGNDRMRDSKSLLEYDVVLTTYGVLTSDNSQNSSGPGLVSGIHWYRIMLDEAHTIKNLRSQSSQAIFKLSADCRWCLTGTPIQNKLEDVFSLLHFLRIEPWGNLGWWTKLIQKPFDEGDERGLKLLQAVLKPLMLRRTKETVDKEGRPIIVLPPADMQVIECELSEQERDFYEALFKKLKVKFDMFVEQGKVLHNYASILELLLRLRQCCDHPYLVMSRGDTDEFADLNKLARHFMEGVSRSGDGPTRAYVEEVVKEFRKGERAECPICLEVMEDAVLTSCAHSVCRECLFASWPSYGGGSCPICRQYVSRQELITAPKESRFHLDVEKNWRASSKVMALMKELEKVLLLGEKSVVFSQWTSFLDLLQIPLNRGKIRYVRLDGSLSQQQREQVIKNFSNDPKILVMLISLKAGGVGLNLTAASHAFLLDPWWNPAVEEQAIMRIHRIGQVRDVFVKRFICKDTVEQRMLLVQARKQRMIAGALNNQEVRAARLEELKMLFR
ncbi:unnamed protein product [Calypogeia fissa]